MLLYKPAFYPARLTFFIIRSKGNLQFYICSKIYSLTLSRLLSFQAP